MRFLADIVRMQSFKPPNDLCGTGCWHIGVVRNCLCNLKAGVIGHVVLKHIQNETFLNSLLHGIDMEGMERPVFVFCSKHFKSLSLGRCGKGKEGKILMLAMGYHFLHELILLVNFILCQSFQFCVLPQSCFGICQCGFQLDCGRPRLG